VLDFVLGLDLVFVQYIVFAGNAVDIILTHDHDDNSPLFLDHNPVAGIFTFPTASGHGGFWAKVRIIWGFLLSRWIL